MLPQVLAHPGVDDHGADAAAVLVAAVAEGEPLRLLLLLLLLAALALACCLENAPEDEEARGGLPLAATVVPEVDGIELDVMAVDDRRIP